jgi:hypothetical protein
METDPNAYAKLLQADKPAPLTLTPEQIRKAASRCPDAAMVLKELFPHVFAEPLPYRAVDGFLTLNARALGSLKGCGYYLPVLSAAVRNAGWKIVMDEHGAQVLVHELKS